MSKRYGGIADGVKLLILAAALLSVLFAPRVTLAEPYRIIAFGDSLTAGYGLPPEQSFPARLEAALKARGLDVAVVNAGHSGETSTGALDRLDWTLADGGDLVIVEFGGNDMRVGADPAVIERNLTSIVSAVKARGMRVLLAGMMAPNNLGTEYQGRFNALYPRIAREQNVAFYPFFLDGVALRGELNQRDGIHPNARGVEVIVARILPKVLETMGRTQ
jgi:acyl-CoA thioesterase-1